MTRRSRLAPPRRRPLMRSYGGDLMAKKSKPRQHTPVPALRGQAELAIVIRPEDMFPDPGNPDFPRSPDPLEGTDPSKSRDIRLAEIFSGRYWGYRKLGKFTQPRTFPDVVAEDLATTMPVTIELTELAHERDQVRHRRTKELKDKIYMALASRRPKFRAWAISVLHTQGEFTPLPNPNSREGKQVAKEFVECLDDGFDKANLNAERLTKPSDYYWRIPVDAAGYPTLIKYVREMRAQPTAPGSPSLPSPDDPILLFGSQANVYVEGERPALLAEAIARKASRGPDYRADILLVHTWADLYILRGPEGPEDMVVAGKRTIRDLRAQRQFGEMWLMDTLTRKIWRIWP